MNSETRALIQRAKVARASLYVAGTAPAGVIDVIGPLLEDVVAALEASAVSSPTGDCRGCGGDGVEIDDDPESTQQIVTTCRDCGGTGSAVPSPPTITDDMVERAAHAMFEEPGAMSPDDPDYMTWDDVVREDPSRADIWREDARRVLAAALHPGGETSAQTVGFPIDPNEPKPITTAELDEIRARAVASGDWSEVFEASRRPRLVNREEMDAMLDAFRKYGPGKTPHPGGETNG